MNSNKNIEKRRKVIYRITTTVIALVFLVTGIGNLLPFPHIAQDMAHLGFPHYFLTILGVWKILAATITATPGMSKMKEWAFAGMMLDLTGAAFSRFSSGDGAIMILIPLALSCLVFVNYILRYMIQKTSQK